MSSVALPIEIEFLLNADGPDYIYTPGGFPGGNYYGAVSTPTVVAPKAPAPTDPERAMMAARLRL